MPNRGIRSFCFSSSKSSAHSGTIAGGSPPLRDNSPESMAEEDLAASEEVISKWDPGVSPLARVSHLFHDHRREARAFMKSVGDLQQTMHDYAARDSRSEKLIRAQNLMKTAIKILQREFHQILSENRDHLDPESVSGKSSANTTVSSFSELEDDAGAEEANQTAQCSIEEVERVSVLAMMDLQSIAECMISAGYGKECIKTYRTMRKSIIDEGLYRMGFERTSVHQLHKQDWEIMEQKIKSWLQTVKVAVKTLFAGERILCDHVFASSIAIKESCFSDISMEAALLFFQFPELVVKCKKSPSPEKIFRLLDMYEVIHELRPEIDKIFSNESTSPVRSQVVHALSKLLEVIRSALMCFESHIQKESTRSPPPEGGIHPLTRYVMDYLCTLSDYSAILADVFADGPFKVPFSPTLMSVIPNSLSAEDQSSSSSSPAMWFAWVILVLLCKLDVKAENYKDVGLAYLFLSINLQHVVTRVKGCNLVSILTDDWVIKQEEKVNSYAQSYAKITGGRVVSALPEEVPGGDDGARAAFRDFNMAFQETYRKSSGWPVPDRHLRDVIRASLVNQIVPRYRCFYDNCPPPAPEKNRSDGEIRVEPRDVEGCLMEMFCALDVSALAANLVPARR